MARSITARFPHVRIKVLGRDETKARWIGAAFHGMQTVLDNAAIKAALGGLVSRPSRGFYEYV